jgi:hypothetical protein
MGSKGVFQRFWRINSMPVLSIIACRILEDELTRVLSLDDDVRHIILFDNMDGLGLSKKLHSQNRAHLLVPELDVPNLIKDIHKVKSRRVIEPILNKLCSICGKSLENSKRRDLIVAVNVLRMALHSDSKLLKDEVYRNIREMAAFSDGILLFYGLCGNTLGDISKDLADLKCPIYFLTDRNNNRVDDCISVALGGNKEYETTLSKCPGVGIFFTPMWAYNWREIDKEVGKSSKSKCLGEMLNDLGYQSIAKLDTGLHYISDFELDSRIQEFAKSYNLEIVHLQGCTNITDNCYKHAKECMNI